MNTKDPLRAGFILNHIDRGGQGENMTQETQVELDQEEAAFQAELANETEDVSAPLVNEKKTAEDNVSVDVKSEDAKLERIEVIPGYTKEELDAVLTEVQNLICFGKN